MSNNKFEFLQLLESSACFDQNKRSVFSLILETQPIECKIIPGTELHWAPGAADGAYFLHFKQEDDEARAAEAFALFDKCIRNPSVLTIKSFYNYFFENTFVYFEYPFRHLLAEEQPDLTAKQEIEYIEKAVMLGQWLIKNSPDIEQVKVGIGLLCVFQARSQESIELIKVIARHDEFTFFAINTLNSFAHNQGTIDYTKELLELVYVVEGWGRIFIIFELLKLPLKPDIKQWLLREGYKNSINYQYTAYAVAVAGDLLEELKVAQVDEKLLDGAAAILSALCESGPMQSLQQLPNGAAIAELFLQHMSQRDLKPAYQQAIQDIHNFKDSDTL